MTVEVPDEWAKDFERFDRMFLLLSTQDSLSAASVGLLVRACGGGDKVVTFRAWAAIRHGAASMSELRDIALSGQ